RHVGWLLRRTGVFDVPTPLELKGTLMNARPRYLTKGGQRYAAVALAAAALFALPHAAQAAVAIATAGSASDATNYGPAGLEIGTQNICDRRYWFANFGAASAVTGAPVDQSAYNKLPGWMSV